MSYIEKQLTTAERHHQLTNINIWTPDSQWLVYDVRQDESQFTGETIERVNVETGECEILYEGQEGACVGVATVAPQEPTRYAFIRGPQHPDAQWSYAPYHRCGMILNGQTQQADVLDALDITAPYTVGALRGGSHVHVFSPDGSRLSFTYNDYVMHQCDPALDLRNVAVALPMGLVTVERQHPREHDGSHFCQVISKTTSQPTPGSDEISRAYEEGWVGQTGYQRSDGKLQRWALAFIGDTRDENNQLIPEVFIADLPENLDAYRDAGEHPIEGGVCLMPAPAKTICQRRLTDTRNRRYPGVVTSPRHWLRASPNGEVIAFLMRDDNGVIQLWFVSPNGGELMQVTHGRYDVQSAFSWSPDGHAIAFVMDNSIVRCDVVTGAMTRLTPRSEDDNAPLPSAVVYSPDSRYIAFLRTIEGYAQVCVVETLPHDEPKEPFSETCEQDDAPCC